MPSVIWNSSVTGNFWVIEGCVCKSGQAEEASQTQIWARMERMLSPDTSGIVQDISQLRTCRRGNKRHLGKCGITHTCDTLQTGKWGVTGNF